MADAPATPAPAAPAAPAAAGAAAPATPAAAPTPAIDPSTAGRTLQQLRQARKDALRGEPAAAAPKGPLAPGASPPSPATPEAAAAGATPSAGEGGDPAEVDPDEDLAALIREQRRLNGVKTDLETRVAAVKDVEEAAPLIRTAREHLAKGDLLGAVKTVFGEPLMKDLLWALLRENPDQAEEATPDPRQLIRDELAAREKADQEKRDREAAEKQTGEQARLAAVDAAVMQPGFAAAVAAIPTLKGIDTGTIEAFGRYVAGVTAAFKADPAKYKAVDRLGVTALQVVQCSEKFRAEHKDRRPPTTTEVLELLNTELLGVSRELVGVAERPPIPTFSADWKGGAGAPEPEAKKPQTLDEKRAARKAKLHGSAA